jgi:hypothetical protein
MKKRVFFLAIFLGTLGLGGCGGGSSGKKDVSSSPRSSLTFTPSSLSNNSSSSEIASLSSLPASSTSVTSSARSISSSGSSVIHQTSALLMVNDQPLVAPLLATSVVPETLQSTEKFKLRWVAYSTEGEVDSVNWSQISGPEVLLENSKNQLEITAGAPGIVVLEMSLAGQQDDTAKKQISFSVVQPASPKAKLLQGNSRGIGLDLVIVGDGFLLGDQEKLELAARDSMKYFFEYENGTLMPYTPLVNLWLVESVSVTRDIPTNGMSGNTLFGAFFNCAAIFRLLCVNDGVVVDFVAEHLPQYDQILVLVNSDIYGGAGGAIATASLNDLSKDIVLHELGHSVGYLADEYLVDSISIPGYEPDQPNSTSISDLSLVKWNHWIEDMNQVAGVNKTNYADDEVGFFEGSFLLGLMRPTFNSFMRNLGQPFGNVNREAWALAFWRHFSSDTGFAPVSKQLSISEKPVVFSVPVTIDPEYTRVTWWVNDVKVKPGYSSQFLVLTAVDESIQSVKVVVEDNTGFIRRDVNGVSKLQYVWSAGNENN